MLSFIMPRQTKMDKKIIISATAAIVMAISGHPHAAGQSPWISNDTLAHNLVWEDKLYRQVEFLSDSLCGGRATGSAGGNEAAFWIIRNFRESGLMSPGPGYGRHIPPYVLRRTDPGKRTFQRHGSGDEQSYLRSCGK